MRSQAGYCSYEIRLTSIQTSGPQFPRLISFHPPLFKNDDATNRPWLTEVVETGVEPDDTNLQYSTKIYEILKAASAALLIESKQKLATMIAGGQATSDEINAFAEHIGRMEAQAALGGSLQTPWVSHEEYAFPIYAVRRDNGVLPTFDLPIARYQCDLSGLDDKNQLCDQWQPPWPFASQTENGSWLAHQVPLAGTPKFSSAGPSGLDSDGTVILFDELTKTEYDFWQVTMNVGDGGKSTGGGISGTQMEWAGSLCEFQTTGPGARDPNGTILKSSRASGLPYLGGLILPEDFAENAGGWINHALAFSLPRLRKFDEPIPADRPNCVYPATDTEKHNSIPCRWALAAGQRITLKQSIRFPSNGQIVTVPTQQILDDADIPLVVKSFIHAIMKYGAYLVDGGKGFGFAVEDSMTANPDYTESHVQKLIGDFKFDSSRTLWANIIDALDEWLSSRLGIHLFGEAAGLAFAIEDDKGNHFPNYRVVKNLKSP